MMSPDLNPSESLLLIIDIQERLSKTMDQKVLRRVSGQIGLLTAFAAETKMPVFLTEQYAKGLGPTIAPIQKNLKGVEYAYCDKLTFGCCEDADFLKKLKALGRKQIILTGMETHICVYLTVLGLIREGYEVFVASDAVLSRDKFYYKNGLDLIRQAGGVVGNAETFLFQMMKECGSPLFKKMSGLLKDLLGRGHRAPTVLQKRVKR